MSDAEIPVGLFLEPAYVIEDESDDDDFEYQQTLAEGDSSTDGAFVGDIFHGALSSAPRIDMYRSWVWPDLYPNERPARLENWPDEDIEMYCGTRKGMNDRG